MACEHWKGMMVLWDEKQMIEKLTVAMMTKWMLQPTEGQQWEALEGKNLISSHSVKK